MNSHTESGSAARQVPNIVHPVTFRIGGFKVRVATFSPVTDDEARRIAAFCFSQQPPAKKDLQKTLTFLWLGDRGP